MISKFLNTEFGCIILSVILGLGLAALFRQACKGNNCLVVNGPKVSEIQKYYYKLDEDCFKYTPYVTKCDQESNKP
jgi:hypothetical protein